VPETAHIENLVVGGGEAALREFVLPYDAVAKSATPDQILLEFLQAPTKPPPGRRVGTRNQFPFRK